MTAGLPLRRSALACLLLGALALTPASRAASITDPLGALPAAGSAYRSVKAPGCTLKGARTVVANRHVRIFNAIHAKHGALTFGCLRSADRAYALGFVGECQNNDVVDTAVVAGTVAALNVNTCGLASSETRIALVTLRNGHVVFASEPLSTPGDPDGHDAIRGMVVTPRGRLAWLGVRIARGVVVGAEVRRRAHGPDRHSVVIDGGSDIDPRSLRRHGSRVSWFKGGAARSAAL